MIAAVPSSVSGSRDCCCLKGWNAIYVQAGKLHILMRGQLQNARRNFLISIFDLGIAVYKIVNERSSLTCVR